LLYAGCGSRISDSVCLAKGNASHFRRIYRGEDVDVALSTASTGSRDKVSAKTSLMAHTTACMLNARGYKVQ
jgi:hypothetical protein